MHRQGSDGFCQLLKCVHLDAGKAHAQTKTSLDERGKIHTWDILCLSCADNLCSELDHERKTQYTIQQRLKGNWFWQRQSNISIEKTKGRSLKGTAWPHSEVWPWIFLIMFICFKISNSDLSRTAVYYISYCPRAHFPSIHIHTHTPTHNRMPAFVLNDPFTFFPEAHDALHHFSCKMLTPRHCTGTCTFKSPLLPPWWTPIQDIHVL